MECSKLLISSRVQQQHSGLTKPVFDLITYTFRKEYVLTAANAEGRMNINRITIGFNVVKAQGARFMSMKS